MTITLDATQTAYNITGHAVDETWNGSITIGSLTNGFLVVMMSTINAAPTGVQLDGTTGLTKVTGSDLSNIASNSSLWYLKNPPLGGHTIKVLGLSQQDGAAIMSSWAGVDQTTPFGTLVTSTPGSSTGDILSVTGASGSVLIDCLTHFFGDTNAAPEGTQTRLGEAQAGLAQGSTQKVDASYKVADSGNMEMDPDGGVTINGVHLGIALLPAAGGGGSGTNKFIFRSFRQSPRR